LRDPNGRKVMKKILIAGAALALLADSDGA
jgi:hypothetical protein